MIQNKTQAQPSSMSIYRRNELMAGEITAYANAHSVFDAAINFGIGMDTVKRVIARREKKLKREGIKHEDTKNRLISSRALYDSDKSYFESFFRAVLAHVKKQEDTISALADQSSRKDGEIALLQLKVAELQANPKVEVEETLMQELGRIINK